MHGVGTGIGIPIIKQHRLRSRLQSIPGLCVGDCVQFYLCPRSVMLYVLFNGNHQDLRYRGGQNGLFTWKQTWRRWWPGPMRTTFAGRLLFPTQVPRTSKTGTGWSAWRKSIGTPCEHGTGGIARNRSKRSSLWRAGPIGPFFVGCLVRESTQRSASNAIRGAPHQPSIEVMRDWYC